MTIYRDECDGCLGYRTKDGFCEILTYTDRSKCPCSECLVKVTCNKLCDDLCDFFSSIYKFRATDGLKNEVTE